MCTSWARETAWPGQLMSVPVELFAIPHGIAYLAPHGILQPKWHAEKHFHPDSMLRCCLCQHQNHQN